MAAGPDDRSPPPYRHNIPRSACRLLSPHRRRPTPTAVLSVRQTVGSASLPATGSRALAVLGGGGTASTLPGRGAHPPPMPPRVPNLWLGYDSRRSKNTFRVDAHLSEDRARTLWVLRIGSKNVSINEVGDGALRIAVIVVAADIYDNNAQSWRSSYLIIKTS